MRPGRRATDWRSWLAVAFVLLAVSTAILLAVLLNDDETSTPIGPLPTPTRDSTPVPTATTEPSASPTAISSPTPAPTYGPTLPCDDIFVPVNKERSLPVDCAPAELVALPGDMAYVVGLPIILRPEVAAAMEEMLLAAREEGFVMVVRSAYRGYSDQEWIYQNNVEVYGQDYADRSSARAGHSEHQLGTTADVTSQSNNYELEGFENTPEAGWIAANAYRFGFVISYPEGKEEVTGYVYEPWHLRFVGPDIAEAIRESGLAPVEFLENRGQVAQP